MPVLVSSDASSSAHHEGWDILLTGVPEVGDQPGQDSYAFAAVSTQGVGQTVTYMGREVALEP